jgi:hypothetical protein
MYRPLRHFIEISTVATFVFAFLSPAPAAVIWKYDFNEFAVADTLETLGRIKDSSGAGRDGFSLVPPTSSTTFAAGPAEYGGTTAAVFTSGADGIAHVPGFDFGDSEPVAGPDFDFGTDNSFTVETLVKFDTGSTINVQGLVSKGGGSTTTSQWWWRTEGGKPRFLARDDGTTIYSLTGVADLRDGEWHHIALVHDDDANRIELYVDYELDNFLAYSGEMGIIDNDNSLRIAAWEPATSSAVQFVGMMDFAIIHTGALSTQEFVQPVPEPSSALLAALASTGMIGVSRRRRRD